MFDLTPITKALMRDGEIRAAFKGDIAAVEVHLMGQLNRVRLGLGCDSPCINSYHLGREDLVCRVGIGAQVLTARGAAVLEQLTREYTTVAPKG